MKRYMLVALICAGPAFADPADPGLAQFQQWIDQRYIKPFAQGDNERWKEVLADDVVGLHNRVPAMEGIEAVGAFGEMVAETVRVENLSVTLQGARVNGDWAYTWGVFHSDLFQRADGTRLPGHVPDGKVFLLWSRQADGEWKISVDMGNDLPEPQS